VKYKLKIINVVLVFVFLIGFVDFAFASITDGTIDNVYKYAWSENAGWINFGTTQGNVRITDSAITGYAWSDNYGWINLSPTQSGVTNNGEGTLSGYAWGENLGWIDFSNVSINASGKFTGTASGTISGVITFNCNNCNVRTDWRPRSTRPAAAPSGGGMPSAWFNPPKAPERGFKVLINNDAKYTNSPTTTLNLFGGPEAARMAVSNNPEFSGKGSTGQIPFQSFYQWNLCQGLISCPEDEYTVYVKFFAPWGLSSETVSDSIVYRKEKPIAERIPEIIERVPEILESLIPEILKPKPPEMVPKEITIEELASKEAPLAFREKWQLLPSEPIREFVLAPLPKEVRKLAEKFPELGETLKKIGITKITDIEKLKAVKLTLPGLTEKVGLPTAKIEPGKFALPQGVSIAELSPKIKETIPSEIVFAKTGGELIDFNITLSITEKGEPLQKIETISGKPLQLVVKPDKPVKSVKGYVVFKSKIKNQISKIQTKNEKIILNSLLASVFFALPSFAKTHDPVEIETRLVLLEFEYTDPDGDGIYTAEIQTPLVEGEYEIITVMDFEDPELSKREIRLITIIDPEGYVYERDRDKETRIPGAIVSLWWLNPETKQYELWPAREYQQENPQTTDVRGTYSFLVPEGYYYLKTEAPGYLVYDGKPFQVKEGNGIHINIELKTKYWWLKVVDWKTILLVAVIILLLYNFHRDKIRERLLKYQK
jgi:hypothetical protein